MNGLLSASVLLMAVGFSHGRVICDSTSYCDDGWFCCEGSKCCRYTHGYTGYSSSSGSSNGGAIAGIVIGSIVGLVIVMIFCARVITYCKNRPGTVQRATVNPVGYSQGLVKCDYFSSCDDTWYCCKFDECCKIGHSNVDRHECSGSGCSSDDDDDNSIITPIVVGSIFGFVFLCVLCARVIIHFKKRNIVSVFRVKQVEVPNPQPPAYPAIPQQGRQQFGPHRDAGVGPGTSRPGQTLNVPRPGGLDGSPWKKTRPPSAFPDGMPPQYTRS